MEIQRESLSSKRISFENNIPIKIQQRSLEKRKGILYRLRSKKSESLQKVRLIKMRQK